MCVWSDGYVDSVKVRSVNMLKSAIMDLLSRYDEEKQLRQMQQWVNYSLKEEQFAQFVGKCRMYQYLPTDAKKLIQPMLFGDQQTGAVVRDFYRDQSFCKDSHGDINLWRMYNLFTGVNKSSYIDSFLGRSVNAFSITDEVKSALDGNYSWYLN